MIGTLVAPVFVDGEVPAGVIDGVAGVGNCTFTLAYAPATGSLKLYDGLRLKPTTDYTITGLTITTTVAPEARTDGSALLADYRR